MFDGRAEGPDVDQFYGSLLELTGEGWGKRQTLCLAALLFEHDLDLLGSWEVGAVDR